ncbi:MAG: hypothetical protein UH239_09735 [Acutalibacteraceae bacterium]|nr:hypothetical protein [Acutalibacteraceae bacterium]
MNSIEISENKSMKLTNVLIREINVEVDEIITEVERMENYIKSKGMLPIGPLVQKMSCSIDENGQAKWKIFILRQVNNYIHHVEKPYFFEKLIRIKKAMYAHYVGPEEKIRLAHEKIKIIAFEKDIDIADESYTIYVGQENDNVIVDVFVEKKD